MTVPGTGAYQAGVTGGQVSYQGNPPRPAQGAPQQPVARTAIPVTPPPAAPKVITVPPPAPKIDPPPGTAVIQGQPDGTLVVSPLPSGLAGDDAGQINAALLEADGKRPVRLAGGAQVPFRISSPIVLPYACPGTVLEGVTPVNADAGGQVADIFGSVIQVQPGFTAAGFPLAAAIYMDDNGLNSPYRRPVVRNLWIDLRTAPAGINISGIAAYGEVYHVLIDHVGIWGNSADAGQNGMTVMTNPATGKPDGWEVTGCMIQSCGQHGIFWSGGDSVFSRVHCQAAPLSTTTGSGFYCDQANNVRFIACRADQSVYGWTFDSNPGGVPNAPGAQISLEGGCGSQNCYKSALNLINTSSGGTQIRTPVAVIGAIISYPGRDGVSPAVIVNGQNTLTMTDCSVLTGGNGYPVAGLKTVKIGAAGVPNLVQVIGGIWNCETAGQMIQDTAPAAIMSYSFYGFAGAGGILGGVAPTALTLFSALPP